MTFNPNKPVKQRNGRAARIICTDAKGEKPIVALIDYSTAFGCEEEPWLYYSDGRCELGRTSQYDLINIEEPDKPSLESLNTKLDELLRRVG